MSSHLFFGEKDIMLNATEAVKRYERLVPTAQVELLLEKGHALTGLAESIMALI